MSTEPAGSSELRLAGTDTPVSFVPERLVIAGYTGADQEATRRHIDELAAIGVAPPPSVPMFYEVAPDLLTFGSEIVVAGAETSGEVEPVLYCTPGGWYVGVGSDHTARDIERESVERSKRACPKVASRKVVPYDALASRWGRLRLRSFTGADPRPYQDASLAELLPAAEIVAAYEERDGDAAGPDHDGLAMFLGTVPVRDGTFVFADTFRGELVDPAGGLRLTCSYRISQGS